MKNYLSHLNKQYSKTTIKRKIEYLDYNFSKYIDKLDKKQITILEIGPGFGEFESLLNRKGITNIDIVDNDKYVLKYVKKKYKINKSILTDNIKETTKELRKYDIILLVQMFEHIPKNSYKSFITTLFVHLKTKGKIIITVPNGANPISIIERYNDIQHESAFTENSLKELPNYCNISSNISVSIEPYNIPLTNFINILRYIIQKILHIFLILLEIANGGVFQKIMTPNITLIITKNE